MRNGKTLVSLVALVTVLSSCASVRVAKPGPALSSRFRAALEIKDKSVREEALVVVALDAASAGEIQVWGDAFAAIETPATRNEVAAKAAAQLALAGDVAQAILAAREIEDSAQRDEVLANIAKGAP
jgi:hypothetical protein